MRDSSRNGGNQRTRQHTRSARTGVPASNDFGAGFEAMFALRQKEADEFYASRIPEGLSDDAKSVMRQAFAGMLWCKQFYHYDVRTLARRRSRGPASVPRSAWQGRNKDWTHLYNDDIISMPDKWEYPWYAAWDLAFHCIPLALIDPDFAKEQLILLLREWYMHPNGQLPAYEWAFGDVNPPVHAWAAWRVYKIERRVRGVADRGFLEKVFHKLLLNFTWWVNRKDPDGMNIFQGGFLGLDNIGVFDRSAPLPTGRPPGTIRRHQLDGHVLPEHAGDRAGTGERRSGLRRRRQQILRTFREHRARHERYGFRRQVAVGRTRTVFTTTCCNCPNGEEHFVKIRSMVGLIPLFAVETLEPEIVDRSAGFQAAHAVVHRQSSGCAGAHRDRRRRSARGVRRLLSLVNRKQLEASIWSRCWTKRNSLSPYGIRALFALSPRSSVRSAREWPRKSRGVRAGRIDHRAVRRQFELARADLVSGELSADRVAAEVSSLFWRRFQSRVSRRAPARNAIYGRWLRKFRAGSIEIFPDAARRPAPVAGGAEVFQTDPHWKDLILFYEYFHGDNGAGIGASHQTGWTGWSPK